MPAGVPKRLNWKWEELVLACDLVMQNNGRILDDTDPHVIELSELLRQMPLHPQEDRLPEFRNPNGVSQKTRNLVQHLPGYTGSPSRGSALDREVVERFIAEPEAMHELAESIRASVTAGEPLEPRPAGQAASLAAITREAVLSAIAEYDELGQDAFLDKYGFHPARSYGLVHNGKRYDSKAIVGVAHGHLPGRQPPTPGEFSGGEATVGRLLRKLGFTVQVGDDLTPDRLERILARLQVYRRNRIPVLPVLVQVFYSPPGTPVILEQPEIHLHPAAQSALGDVLLGAVKDNGAQFIEAGEGRSEIHELKLDEYGNITNWPQDFFGDEMGDLAAMTEAAVERRSRPS